MTTLERIDRRILGTVRVLDATTVTPITRRLVLSSPILVFGRNRRAFYTVEKASGLESHDHAFLAPPASPPVGSIRADVTIHDPLGMYVPRRHTLHLPRNADPASADQPDSVFRPVDVVLYPAPTAKTSHNWVSLYVSIRRDGGGTPIAGALLRVLRNSDSQLLARGMTDARGEALVAIAGIPVTTWEEGTTAVLTSELLVTLEAIVDPDAAPIADPDDIETRRTALPSQSVNITVAAGRRLAVQMTVAVP